MLIVIFGCPLQNLIGHFQGLVRIIGLAIVLDVANFIAQKTLDFPKASLKIVY